MTDNRMMEEMLQAPTEWYGDAIVVPDILAENFEIKTGLLSLIQANQFHGFESNNPHDHIRSFNRITSTLKFKDLAAFKVSTTSSGYSSSMDARINKLTDTISNSVETFNKKMTTPTTVKAVEETSFICEGAHPYYDCIATDSNISSACATTGLDSLPRNTIPNTREDLIAITTRSGVTLAGPSVSPPLPPSKEVDREPEMIMN
nr:reverse transcriptase domain-containing protein [Tanacetum cinerariifolium]